jgi:NAD(P)-dependent dehydrogenase (short-subunit alcohol dehydrogenase family)
LGAKMANDRKTAVITGAAGGIGKAIAKRFVDNGFLIVAGDADQAGLRELSGVLNNGTQRVWEASGDLRSKAYCEGLIDHAVSQTGRLDVLVNNAGIITRGNILETSDEDWARTFDINLTAVFHTCRRAIAFMKGHGGGVIVNVSSCWGLYPGPNHPAYCTSKAAVAAFSKCLGRDHAADGIRVNAVCPNEVNTPMLRTGFARRGLDPDTAIRELNKSVPLGRIYAGDVIVVPVVYLRYLHEFADDSRTIEARVREPTESGRPGEADEVSFRTNNPDRNYFSVGGGVFTDFGLGLSAFASFDVLFGHSYRDEQTVNVGVRGTF